MKKAIVGLLAVGSIIALRPVVRRLGQRMREHCEHMVAQFGGRGEMGQRMGERCEQMTAQSEARGEAAYTMPECCEQMAAQFGGRGEAVGRT
jgi:hypothetical protein